MSERNWFNLSVNEVEEKVNTNKSTGLNLKEVEKRQSECGFNEIRQAKKKSIIIKITNNDL